MDWLAAFFEILGLWLVGNKRKIGFLSCAACSILWVWIGLRTHLYGLLIVAVACFISHIRNYWKWKMKKIINLKEDKQGAWERMWVCVDPEKNILISTIAKTRLDSLWKLADMHQTSWWERLLDEGFDCEPAALILKTECENLCCIELEKDELDD